MYRTVGGNIHERDVGQVRKWYADVSQAIAVSRAREKSGRHQRFERATGEPPA